MTFGLNTAIIAVLNTTKGKQMAHKLSDQLTAAQVSDDEIEELFADLQFVFENPFDDKINEAISQRQCSYIEQAQPRAH